MAVWWALVQRACGRYREGDVVTIGVALGSAPGAVDEVTDIRLVVVAVLGVLLLVAIRAFSAWRGPRAAPGEVWFAQVPFADGTGSKDRPVLVLAVQGSVCTVARFTSRDRTARRDHRRVPGWLPGLHGDSWADLRPLTVRRRALRRRVAAPNVPLLAWYQRESGWSAAA